MAIESRTLELLARSFASCHDAAFQGGRIHHDLLDKPAWTGGSRGECRRRDCGGRASLWFLPTYCPIQKVWSKVRAWLRRVSARTFEAIGQALVEVLQKVSPNECVNYYNRCGMTFV